MSDKQTVKLLYFAILLISILMTITGFIFKNYREAIFMAFVVGMLILIAQFIASYNE